MNPSAKNTLESTADPTPATKPCPACEQQSAGNICMHCGENLYPRRLNVATMVHEVPDIFFNLDRGLFYTMRNFLFHPGRMIKRYFAGDRSRHYKPLKYITFIGGLTALLYARFVFTDGKPQSGFEAFGTQWTSLILLLQVPLIALTTWLLFRKKQHTYGEHLVANAYIIAEVSLFNIALFPLYYLLDGTSNIAIAQGIYSLSILFYYSFVFYDWFYDRKGTEGKILSFIFVFVLFIMVIIFTFIIQALLYYIFIQMHWL